MLENKERLCVYCDKPKIWNWNGKKLKDGSKIFVDAQQKRWAGKRCPDCERGRVNAAIRCDSFEKNIIISQLIAAGYQIISKTLPLKVKRGGEILTVGVKRAYTENGQIVLESQTSENEDLYALVFESVRICDVTQMNRLAPNISIFDKQRSIVSDSQFN